MIGTEVEPRSRAANELSELKAVAAEVEALQLGRGQLSEDCLESQADAEQPVVASQRTVQLKAHGQTTGRHPGGQ